MHNTHDKDKIRIKSGPVWLAKRPVYHALFWLFCLTVLVLIDIIGGGSDLGSSVTSESINLFFFAIIVYFNLEYLIPYYLTRSRFLNYVGLLIAAAIIVTPIKILVLFFWFDKSPEVLYFLRQNQWLYFISSLLFAFGSTFLRMLTDWLRNLQQRRDLEKQRMQSELNFLKTQINPHFLFNTLNSLYALTLRKSDLAPQIVVKLSEMLRYMLYECNEPYTTVVKELAYLQNYLDLEKLRHGDRIELQYEQTGEVDKQMIGPLLLIPFVENAFKHGMTHAIQKGYVHIKIDIDAQKILLEVKNSKTEAKPLQNHVRSGGIGLVNVRRRLELLYPGQYTLDIDDAPNAYTVQMSLNLKPDTSLETLSLEPAEPRKLARI